MRYYLMDLRMDVWLAVVNGYTTKKRPSKFATKKELKNNNTMTMDAILDGLSYYVKIKLVKCTTTKEIWDKLYNLYKVEEEANEEWNEKGEGI